MAITTVDEAEEIAKEYVAKKFDLHDFQTITTTFDGDYFTVSVGREVKHQRIGVASEQEAQHTEVHKPAFCDVKVDKNGLVVACARTIRAAVEAEAIAKEYALERYGLTHFIPYTTTFDGSYYTVYAGGLVKSVLKWYKSKFYDVKVDKSGIVVGWTTEGLISHFITLAKGFRLR